MIKNFLKFGTTVLYKSISRPSTHMRTFYSVFVMLLCNRDFFLKSNFFSKPDLDVSADTGIEIYDMAGHEEYQTSHSAMMASLCLESPAVFVLMVDLTKDEKQLSKEIYKWSNLIEIESSSISASVIVVGSRRDELSSELQLLASKCKFVQRIAKDALEKQHLAGFVALDSRQLSTENMEPFVSLLTKSVKDLAISRVNKMSFSCHLLRAFFEQVIIAKAISFDSLQESISRHDALSPFSEPTRLTSTLGTLADKGLILFLYSNDCLSSSCIIINKVQLLREINGTLFAPAFFKEYRGQIASNTGIVPISLLQNIFPHYRGILVAILTSLQFCRPVEPALLANISTNLSPESATSDELLYFPALVSAERPGDLSITDGFGWCMYCTNRRQCLTQRCKDSILLDSAYRHCLSYPTPPDLEHPNEEVVRKLCRSCTVWKNGIYWLTDEGTEVMVQVSDENRCVSLLVSLNQECPDELLELRSSVIDTIRSKQKELCSSVEIHEYLISPSQLSHVPYRNFSELTVFATEDVVKSIRNKKHFVSDCKRKERLRLACLLHFDPYQVFTTTALQELFASDRLSEPVPASFFAGKDPLVSGLSDQCVCVCVVYSVVCDLTDVGIVGHVLFLPLPCVCLQKMAKVVAADLSPSPQGAPPTSATPTLFVPSAGIVTHLQYIVRPR